jgi:hypothetical protein
VDDTDRATGKGQQLAVLERPIGTRVAEVAGRGGGALTPGAHGRVVGRDAPGVQGRGQLGRAGRGRAGGLVLEPVHEDGCGQLLPEDAGQAEVVGVEMGHHDASEGGDAGVAELAQQVLPTLRGVGSGIDDDGAPVRAEEHRAEGEGVAAVGTAMTTVSASSCSVGGVRPSRKAAACDSLDEVIMGVLRVLFGGRTNPSRGFREVQYDGGMTVNDILIGVIALITVLGGIGMVGALVAMAKSGYHG